MSLLQNARQLLEQELKLLKQYEQQLQLSDEPREEARLKSEIEECKSEIMRYEEDIQILEAKEWNPVEKKLLRLKEDPKYATLVPLLNLVQFFSNNREYYEPQKIQYLLMAIECIEQMIGEKSALPQVIEEIIAGQRQLNCIFPEKAYKRYPNLNDFIINCLNEKREELKSKRPYILLPIVLVVMTRNQAEELAAGKASLEHATCPEFQYFQNVITNTYNSNWVHRYNPKPELWKPFANQEATIEEFLNNIFKTVPQDNRSIQLKFINCNDLNQENKFNRDEILKLRREGCIVIMDVISMRHPAIQHQFRKSMLDAFPKTIVAKLDSTGDSSLLEHKMLNMMEKYLELECYKRRELDGDKKCDRVENFTDLSYLLRYDNIKEIVSRKIKSREVDSKKNPRQSQYQVPEEVE